jgi:DNA-binding CsgD family transcriptional regulator
MIGPGGSSVRHTETDPETGSVLACVAENACMTGDGVGNVEQLVRAGVTEREADVLWAIAERLRNREIAARLYISVRTVESHVAALLRKLHMDDRAALADLGVRLRATGYAEPPLPTPLTSLVGRDGETAEVSRLVADHRLVTLVGPGGWAKPAWPCTWSPSWPTGSQPARGWPI